MTKSFSDYGISIPSSAGSGNVYTTCPWCSSQRKKKNAKCLSVNIDKGAWICNHCGIVGGLGKELDRARELHWQKPKYIKPVVKPQGELPNSALDWLYSRGIIYNVIVRNKLGFGSNYMPQVEESVDTIIFPYFRNGELVNRKYRAIAEKHFRLETRCELILYGLDDVHTDRVVWVEGEMDKLALEVAGITSAVSVPNGAPPPTTKDYAAQFKFLDADWEKIESVERHVIAVDADEPGARLESELTRRLGIDKCLRVKWPEGCKDANDVLLRHGAEDLRWYIDNAEPYPIEGVVEVSDRHEELTWLYVNGFTQGVSTGWSVLDEYYKVRPGQFTVVTGVPSSGKSNWLDCMMVNVAQQHNWRFAIFSPENLPVEQHMALLSEKVVRKPFHVGPAHRMSPHELNNALEWLDGHFTWILPHDESQWNVDNILKIAGQLCLRYGIRGLVIDPWNELESLRPPSLSETEYISQSLKRIRVFARQRDIHVWVVVHPTKLSRDESGKWPVPSLYDCAGSAHWRNKADNGIVVFRDLGKGPDMAEVQIHIQKIRFRQDGKRGAGMLYYESVCGTYSQNSSETVGLADFESG